jgi:uncharacterized UBP type Zn finger protein
MKFITFVLIAVQKLQGESHSPFLKGKVTTKLSMDDWPAVCCNVKTKHQEFKQVLVQIKPNVSALGPVLVILNHDHQELDSLELFGITSTVLNSDIVVLMTPVGEEAMTLVRDNDTESIKWKHWVQKLADCLNIDNYTTQTKNRPSITWKESSVDHTKVTSHEKLGELENEMPHFYDLPRRPAMIIHKTYERKHKQSLQSRVASPRAATMVRAAQTDNRQRPTSSQQSPSKIKTQLTVTTTPQSTSLSSSPNKTMSVSRQLPENKSFSWSNLFVKEPTLEEKIRASHYKELLNKYPTIPSNQVSPSFNYSSSLYPRSGLDSNSHFITTSKKSLVTTKGTRVEDWLLTTKDKMWEKTVRYQGMQNIGNVCYMNAILQALRGLPTFSSDLANEKFKEAKLPVTSFYRSVLEIIDESLQPDRSVVDPSRVKKAIAQHKALFSTSAQQDAHEFLTASLGQLEDDLATFLKSLRAQQLQEQRPLNFRDRATMLCPTKRNFNFVVQHTLICTKCGETSVSKELFRYFSLDIHSREVLAAMRLSKQSKADQSKGIEFFLKDIADPPSIQDFLDSFFEDEEIEKKCEKCSHDHAILRRKIHRLSRVMILHLKRFLVHKNSETYEKINDRVPFPHTIDIRPYCTPNPKGPIPWDRAEAKKNLLNSKRRIQEFVQEEKTWKETLSKQQEAKQLNNGKLSNVAPSGQSNNILENISEKKKVSVSELKNNLSEEDNVPKSPKKRHLEHKGSGEDNKCLSIESTSKKQKIIFSNDTENIGIMTPKLEGANEIGENDFAMNKKVTTKIASAPRNIPQSVLNYSKNDSIFSFSEDDELNRALELSKKENEAREREKYNKEEEDVQLAIKLSLQENNRVEDLADESQVSQETLQLIEAMERKSATSPNSKQLEPFKNETLSANDMNYLPKAQQHRQSGQDPETQTITQRIKKERHKEMQFAPDEKDDVNSYEMMTDASEDDLDFENFKELLRKHSPSSYAGKTTITIDPLKTDKSSSEKSLRVDELDSSEEENSVSLSQKKMNKKQKNSGNNNSSDNEYPSTKYHLVCVVHHLGQFATCGHYISDIREYFTFSEEDNLRSPQNEKDNQADKHTYSNYRKQNLGRDTEWKSYDDVKVTEVRVFSLF